MQNKSSNAKYLGKIDPIFQDSIIAELIEERDCFRFDREFLLNVLKTLYGMDLGMSDPKLEKSIQGFIIGAINRVQYPKPAETTPSNN